MSEKRDEDTTTFPWLGRKLLWLDDMRNVNRVVYALYALCAGLFLADFVYHKHVYLAVEEFPGFYALYGFFMCALLVVCAKGMRVFLSRDEDYYAPYDVESEDIPDDQLGKVNHDA